MLPSKKIENFYLWAIRALIFLIPFIPIYVSTSMVVPFITGKNFAFRILIEIATALWLGLIVLNKEYHLKNSPVLVTVLVFTFIVGLANLLGVNPYKSFWSDYQRMEGYITILHLALYFMILKSIFRTRKDWIIFLTLFIVVSIFVSTYALNQRFGDENIFRVYSTLGNPPFLASYLVLTVFIGLVLIFNTEKSYLRYVYILTAVLNSIAIYLTATRGIILAIFIGLIFFCLFYIFGRLNTHRENFLRKIALSALVVLLVLSIFLLAIGNTDIVTQSKTFSRFANIFSDPGVKSRLNAWEMAWEGFKERPILGFGQENFISVYSIVPIPYYDLLDLLNMDRAHNIIFDWLINAGFLGFFSYIAIFGVAFYSIWKAIHRSLVTMAEALIVITAFVVYFIQNLFTFDTISTYLIFFALLAYIDNLDYVKGVLYPEVNIVSKQLKFKTLSSITLLAILISSIAIYFINYKPIKVSQLSKQIAVSFPEYKSYNTLLDDFNKALSFKTFGDTDVRLLMVDASLQIMSHKLFKQEGALKFIQATTEEMEKLLAANHYDLRYWRYLISLYNKIAFYEPSFIAKAEALIKECMRLNPEYQWLYLTLSDTFLLKKDYESAFKSVKKAVTLNPESDKIQYKLALAGILTFREEVVNDALKTVKRIRMSKDNIASGNVQVFSEDEFMLLAQTAMEIKNFKQALRFYKEIITISPDEAEYHFNIAKIYLIIGDKINALKEAKKAAELDTENLGEEVKKFINSLKE